MFQAVPPRSSNPKGGKRRDISLTSQTVAMLLSVRHLKGPYVFCDPKRGRLTHSMVKDVVPNLCTKAGLQTRLTMHDLRHTFASHLVMKGKSLAQVQKLLGHTTIQMTMRYVHLSPDVNRAAVEVLDQTGCCRWATAGQQVAEKQKAPGFPRA
jgi:site-specific recombinase XerD